MSHPQHDIFENRKQFQLERMILFSDAVFAIAITLLIIEIKVPEVADTGVLTKSQLQMRLFHLLPQVGGFVMSFIIVGMFWTNHHRIFGYVVNYDGKLLWLNLLLLLCVSFLPFSTSLTSQHGYLDLAYSIYSFNLGMIGLMSYFIWIHIGNPAKKLSVGLEDIKVRRYGSVRSLAISLIFFSGMVLCAIDNPVTSWIARFIFIMIFPVISILKRRYGVRNTVHA